MSQRDANLCNLCNKSFSTTSNLNRHSRDIHHVETSNQPHKFSATCPLCNQKIGDKLTNHLKSVHNTNLVNENLVFDSVEEFKAWKSAKELEESVAFRKCKVKPGAATYVCHRSGKYYPKGGRSEQGVDSIKIGLTCPARIKMHCENEKVIVDYQSTHIGHEPLDSLRRTLISSDRRRLIISLLDSGASSDFILKKVREKFDFRSRDFYVNENDIRRIKFRANLNEYYHSNDSTSCSALISKLASDDQSSNALILFKTTQIGEAGVKTGSFTVGLMSNTQAEILKIYGPSVVILDSTHGTNAYKYQLTSLLTIDSTGQGFPVAHLISRSVSHETLKPFFAAIKAKTGSIPSKVLMTDDDGSFYSAWSSVMGHPEHRLLCSWHVKQSWKRNLSKIRDKNKRIECSERLNALQKELDESKLTMMLNRFLVDFGSTSSSNVFGNYFESQYLGRVNQWAYCYRKQLNINTTMHIERFHRTFKEKYLKSKANTRMDSLITSILSFSDDIIHNKCRVIKLKNQTYRQKMIAASHSEATRMKIDVVNLNSSEDVSEWIIKSKSRDRIFHVRFSSASCNKDCQINCRTCKVCIHQVRCDCLNSIIQSNICKHIHCAMIESRKNSNESHQSPDDTRVIENRSSDPAEQAVIQNDREVNTNGAMSPNNDMNAHSGVDYVDEVDQIDSFTQMKEILTNEHRKKNCSQDTGLRSEIESLFQQLVSMSMSLEDEKYIRSEVRKMITVLSSRSESIDLGPKQTRARKNVKQQRIFDLKKGNKH